MSTATKTQNKVFNKGLEELKIKASILDELVEFIEDRYLGYLMYQAENEPSVPLKKAKKLLR